MTVPNADFTVARTDAAQSFTGTQTMSDLLATTSIAVNLTGDDQQISITKSFIKLSGGGVARTGCFFQNGTVDGQLLFIRAFTWSVQVINNPSSVQNVVFAANAASATFGNAAGQVIGMSLIWDDAASRWYETGRSVR
jgi:hypothetical protein